MLQLNDESTLDSSQIRGARGCPTQCPLFIAYHDVR